MLKASGKIKSLLRSKICGPEYDFASYNATGKSSTTIRTSFFGTSASMARPTRRKLTLISLDWTRPKDPPLSLGHASILTNLRSNGVEVNANAWSVNNPNFFVQDVLDFIFDNAASEMDVALGAFVWNEAHIHEITRTLKKERYPGRIIL
ncbi:hypothetical protein ACHAWX_006348, partial [Stephanocyclus meneghinianus]